MGIYFVAGAEVAAGFAESAGLADFLFFFTCFFVVAVVLLPVAGVAAGAGACAARVRPAVARESPKSIANVFFIGFSFFRFLRGGLLCASVLIDGGSINPA